MSVDTVKQGYIRRNNRLSGLNTIGPTVRNQSIVIGPDQIGTGNLYESVQEVYDLALVSFGTPTATNRVNVILRPGIYDTETVTGSNEYVSIIYENFGATEGITTSGATLSPAGSNFGVMVAASDSSERDRMLADYVCDGVDDHVEIQAAIDDLPSSGGGTVRFARGIYTLNEQIDITTTGTRLEGEGQSFGSTQDCGTVFQCETGDTFVGYYMMETTAGNFFTIRDIAFDARDVRSSESGTPIMECLSCATRDSYIENCSFYQGQVGIRMQKGDIWVDKCYIELMDSYGIVLGGNASSIVDSCWITDNVFWNSSSGTAVDIRIQDYVVRTHIMGNRLTEAQYALRVDGANIEDILMTDNFINPNESNDMEAVIRLNAASTAIDGFLFSDNRINTENTGVVNRLIDSVSGSKITNGLIANNITHPDFDVETFDSDTNLVGIEIRNNIGIESVKAYTASTTIESQGVYTNEGATGSVEFTLPAAFKGNVITIWKIANQDVLITPDGSDTIDGLADLDNTASETYVKCQLTCLTDARWTSESTGTWA